MNGEQLKKVNELVETKHGLEKLFSTRGGYIFIWKEGTDNTKETVKLKLVTISMPIMKK